jgi:hypothetical protein
MNHYAFRILPQYILPVCFAICLPVFAFAQDKAAEKKSALTDGERAEAIKYFEETRQSFLDAVKGLSEAQWKYKPGPDRWSIAEVAEHIAISEETLFTLVNKQIMQSPAAPEKKEAAKGKEAMIRASITNRSVKVQAPEMLKPTNRWAKQDELVKSFNISGHSARHTAQINEVKEDPGYPKK